MPFEVQIRTMEQHRRAEEASRRTEIQGRAGRRSRDERYFQWMRQLPSRNRRSTTRRSSSRTSRWSSTPRGYIFTPKGLVKALPRGATPVDFAYSIHTDLGHQRRRARQRQDGAAARAQERRHRRDRAAGGNSSRDWLNFVATSRARSRIKHLIHAEENARRGLGHKLFEGAPLRSEPEDDRRRRGVRAGADRVRRRQTDDLFAAIGYGKIQPKQVLATGAADSPRSRRRRGRLVVRPSRIGEKIKVKGFDDLMVFRALLQPHSRRKDRRLRDARKGVSVHPPPARTLSTCYTTRNVGSTSSDKSEAVGRYTVKLTMEVEDRRDARSQRQDRRHQHEHQEHGSADRRRSRADRRDDRDQRLKHREGDQIAQKVEGVLALNELAMESWPGKAGRAGGSVERSNYVISRVFRQSRDLHDGRRNGSKSRCQTSLTAAIVHVRRNAVCGPHRRTTALSLNTASRLRRRGASAPRCRRRRSGRCPDRAAPVPTRTATTGAHRLR